MRKYLLFCTVLFLSLSGFSQDFSNKGKDFWVAYGYHQVMFGSGTGGSQEMVLYFATDQVTNITISIPGTGYTQTLTSAAGNNVLTSATIPKNGPFDAHIATEGLHNKGIHITSDKPMVAYAHIYNSSVSGATILYPTNTLGKEYYSVNYKNWSNSQNSNCWFYVIATDTGTTTVEITPTGNTTGGWVAYTAYNVTLTQGQVYNVMGALQSSPNNCNPVCTGYDLTGSLIKSVSSGAGGCKRIAVFSGSGRISITCNGNNSSSDNYMVQSVPKTAWGKKYLTVPAAGNQAFNLYRICVSDPATVVKINGAVTALPLQGNFYYEIPATNQPQMIEADQPVMVAQYFTSQGACGNGNPGDPETIYLSAVEQNINTVLWNATPNFAITTHDVNIVVPNGGTALSSFTLDGAPLTGFTPHPQDANYSYIRKNVGSGFHIIKSDSGFNATAYGFGNAESYGYNAGTNIKDLYQQILVQTQYGIEQTPSVCTGAPFRFKVSLPYCADSLHWDLSNLPGPPPAPPTQIFSTCTPGPGGPDSTTVVNGKTIYWYSLPTLYNFSVIGTYPVTITAYAPNADGCGSVQDIDFNLQISDPPVPNFTWTGGGCPADVVKFQETTPQTPKTTYHFWWDFGDPASGANNNSNQRNPNHVFSGPGTYNVRYSSITTPGCLSDTLTKQVVIPDFPNASITGTATACINTGTLPITFTGTDGTPPYTFFYNINGGGALSVSSAAPAGTTATINAPTNTAGTFVYTLDSVRNLGTSVCVRNITGQTATITVLPDHAIALTSGNNNQTVCINTPIAPITYTLSGGATGVNITGLPAGLTFNVVGTTVTISGTPTTTTGSPFNYNIVTTGNSCLTATANGTITVSPDHTITLNSANSSQTVCINTPIAPIIYTLGGGATNATITGLPAGVTFNVVGTTLTISGSPTTTVGSPFNFNISTTGNSCIVATASGSITVNPDHTIALTSGNNNQTVCINTAIAPITYTLGGGATGVNITGLPAGLTFNVVGTTVTISGTPTTTTGSPFNYNIVTTGNSCLTANATGTITVSPDHTITLNSANSSQTVCINTPITPIAYTLGGGATNATITGLPAGLTYNVVGNILTISGSPTTTVGSPFNFNISTTGNSCIVATASGTITVNPDHTIALTSGNNNQTVCINTAIAPITYTLGGGATNVNITGLPAGLSFTVVGTTVTISGSPTTTTGSPFNYNIVTTGNTCLTASASGTITVSPDHTITLTTANNNQAVCQDIAIVPISFTLGGGATNATVSGLPPGVTYSVVGTTVTISGTPTSAAGSPYNYTVTTSGNSCVVATSTGTITVYKLPTADFNFTVPSCDTRVITFTDLSSPNSGTLQNWSWNFGDPGSGANNTANTGGPIPHVFTSMAGSPYTVTLTVTNSFGCVSNPIASKLVTLHNRPQAGFIVPEVCINDVAAVFIDTSHITAPDVIDPNPASYYWDFGDGSPTAIQHQKDGSHLYTAVGIFTVKHAVTTLAGCTDTVTHQISINGANPTPAFVVNNPTTLCANDSVAIVNQSIVVPGNVTRVQIWWDYANSTVVDIDDDFPAFGKIYKHLYPNFQAPLTKNFTVRMRAYSGTICFNDISQVITVNAAPKVQFNNMPNTCLLVPPFQITQASEIGGVPGTGVFSGPGITPGGIFSPQVAGVGTHTIKYTFTSTAAGCVDTMSKTITVLDTAHATFSNQSPICQNSPASFTDNSTAPAGVTMNNTVWDFGDGSPIENHAPGATFTHTFLNPGTFTVTMYNVSTVGCNSTVFSKSITVDAQHHITPNGANNSQTVCINTNITPIGFTLSGGATGVTVTGLPPGLSFTVVGTQVNITGAPTSTAGSPYAYTVQTTGNTCLPLAQATGTITVNPDHSIALTSAPKSDTQSVCVNAPIVPITYTLGGGATNASVAGLPTGVNFSVVGTTLTISGTPTSFTGGPIFNYTVTTSGNTCLVAQARGQIAVNPYPVPDFTVDKTSYCIPNAVVKFTNTTTLPGGNLSDMTFVWDFGDASGTVPNVHPTHQFTSTGPFNVKLTATSTAVLTPSGIGCSNSIVIPLTTIHPQPKAGFTSDKPSVCQDNPTVTFTDATDYKDGTSSQWHWELGDGSIRTGTATVNYTYSDTITYAVSLYTVNSIGCNSDTITKSFTVYPLPHVNAGPDRYILEGGTIILQPDVFANDPQYLWTPNQYLIDNRVLNVKVDKPQTDMTYTLTVTARGGCQQSDIVFVKLLKFPVIPNTFTPNNDGVNDTWRIDFLNTYPNNRVQVFTRTGQLVFESKGYNTPWDGTLKGKPLPVDTYYYIIEPGNGRDPITGYVTIIK